MPTPTDKILYDTVKKELFKIITKHSEYKSGLLVQKYREEYYKKHKNSNYYTGNKDNSNLKRWFKEKWENQRGEVGYKKKGYIYRPTLKKLACNIHNTKYYSDSQINELTELIKQYRLICIYLLCLCSYKCIKQGHSKRRAFYVFNIYNYSDSAHSRNGSRNGLEITKTWVQEKFTNKSYKANYAIIELKVFFLINRNGKCVQKYPSCDCSVHLYS